MPENYRDWWDRNYNEWRGKQNRGDRSVEKFAIFLGVNRNTLDGYMLKEKTPDSDNVKKIGRVYPDVYRLYGLPQPDPRLEAIEDIWYDDVISEDTKDRAYKLLLKDKQKNERQKAR